jgi:hypothetical protein
MNHFLENLKKQASDNPMLAMGVGAAFLQAASKLLQANTARSNAKTYKKEIDRRVKKSQR